MSLFSDFPNNDRRQARHLIYLLSKEIRLFQSSYSFATTTPAKREANSRRILAAQARNNLRDASPELPEESHEEIINALRSAKIILDKYPPFKFPPYVSPSSYLLGCVDGSVSEPAKGKDAPESIEISASGPAKGKEARNEEDNESVVKEPSTSDEASDGGASDEDVRMLQNFDIGAFLDRMKGNAPVQTQSTIEDLRVSNGQTKSVSSPKSDSRVFDLGRYVVSPDAVNKTGKVGNNVASKGGRSAQPPYRPPPQPPQPNTPYPYPAPPMPYPPPPAPPPPPPPPVSRTLPRRGTMKTLDDQITKPKIGERLQKPEEKSGVAVHPNSQKDLTKLRQTSPSGKSRASTCLSNREGVKVNMYKQKAYLERQRALSKLDEELNHKRVELEKEKEKVEQEVEKKRRQLQEMEDKRKRELTKKAEEERYWLEMKKIEAAAEHDDIIAQYDEFLVENSDDGSDDTTKDTETWVEKASVFTKTYGENEFPREERETSVDHGRPEQNVILPKDKPVPTFPCTTTKPNSNQVQLASVDKNGTQELFRDDGEVGRILPKDVDKTRRNAEISSSLSPTGKEHDKRVVVEGTIKKNRKKRAERRKKSSSDGSSVIEINSSILALQAEEGARKNLKSQRPTPENRFSGENSLIDFDSHFNTYELAMDVPGVTDKMKFFELQHWLSGMAMKVVSMYQNLTDSSDALKRASDHLRLEFGRKPHAAQQMLDDVLAGPPINATDVVGVQSFGLSLQAVYTHARETNRSKVFEIPETHTRIIKSKLPSWLPRWINFVKKHMKRQTEDPKVKDVSFDDLISYIRDQNQYNVLKGVSDRVQVQKEPFAKKFTARIAATSIGPTNRYEAKKSFANTATTSGYGRQAQSRSPQVNSGRSNPSSSTTQSTSRTTETGAFMHWCPSCVQNKPNNHSVASCRPFLTMTCQERGEFCGKHSLCRGCLGRSHAVKDCPNSQSCQICQGNHHVLLCRLDKPEGLEEA